MLDNEDQDVNGDSDLQDLHENDDVGTDDEDSIDEESDRELAAEGDEDLEDETSDPSEEEQSDEDQDNPEQEEEEEATQDKSLSKLKDAKTGNFDWQKINKKVGSDELQKVFVESQKAITRFGQEKSAVEKQYNEFKQTAEPAMRQLDALDQLYRSNPKVQAAIDEALGQHSSQGQTQNQEIQLPQGVDPNDPIVPVLRQQEQMIRQLMQHHQSQAEHQQRQAAVESFRQGLVEAQQTFIKLVGRKATDAELERVAQKMQQTRHLKGSDWVPTLFIEEIQKGIHKEKTQEHRDLKKLKRDLPKTAKSAVAQPKTPNRKLTREELFNQTWDELENK